jgi:hypothetical protein
MAKMAFRIGFLRSIRQDLRIGVAGGLDAATIASLEPLLVAVPSLSWDAEGRLRTNDRLDVSKAEAYLVASTAILGNL